eukprot:s7317_g1.t1
MARASDLQWNPCYFCRLLGVSRALGDAAKMRHILTEILRCTLSPGGGNDSSATQAMVRPCNGARRWAPLLSRDAEAPGTGMAGGRDRFAEKGPRLKPYLDRAVHVPHLDKVEGGVLSSSVDWGLLEETFKKDERLLLLLRPAPISDFIELPQPGKDLKCRWSHDLRKPKAQPSATVKTTLFIFFVFIRAIHPTVIDASKSIGADGSKFFAYGPQTANLAEAPRAPGAQGVMQSMEAVGVLADTVTYSSLLDACAKQGDPERAQQIFEIMRQQGDGLFVNDFFLYALLLAYSRSWPKQKDRAEASFLRFVQNGKIRINKYIVSGLHRAVGVDSSECHQCMAELGGISALVGQLDTLCGTVCKLAALLKLSH